MLENLFKNANALAHRKDIEPPVEILIDGILWTYRHGTLMAWAEDGTPLPNLPEPSRDAIEEAFAEQWAYLQK